MAVQADGVHLGDEDFPVTEARRIMGERYLIGYSTHTVEEAKSAKNLGVDYIGFGPIFDSSSKQGRSAIGLDALRHTTESVSLPVYAIGGIRAEDAVSMMEAGAHGFAVIRGVLGSSDVESAVKSYQKWTQESRIDRSSS